MKVTTPQMGNLEIYLSDLFGRLGVEYIAPPKCSSNTLALGTKISPELACLPFKITVGNFIEGLQRGADTIIMAGGYGPCRFGYYSQVQKIIMEQAGYDFKMITIEPPVGIGIHKFVDSFRKLNPKNSFRQTWQALRVSFKKGRALDLIDRKALQTRCFEAKRGATSKARKAALDYVAQAHSKKEIEEALVEGLKMIDRVNSRNCQETQTPRQSYLKVGLVGEFYMLLEPFVNFDIEEFMGHRGVYVEKGVYATDWVSPTGKNVVFGESCSHLEMLAKPFLSNWVGGEGQATIGHTVSFANRDFDGIIHLYPFTCMPEIIADSILPNVSKKHDIPILTLVIDEQTGRAGVITRLEAFLDLLKARKLKKKEIAHQVNVRTEALINVSGK